MLFLHAIAERFGRRRGVHIEGAHVCGIHVRAVHVLRFVLGL